METNNNARDIYGLDDLVALVKDDLNEFNISETVIKTIIKSYIDTKGKIILNGDKINEEGLGVQKLNYRGVTKGGFSGSCTRGFTVKVVTDLFSTFKNEAMKKLENSEEFENKLKSN